jgi:LEA14-like dessication related protein
MVRKLFSLSWVLLLFVLVSCNGVLPVDVGEIQDIRFKGMTGKAIQLEVDVPIENPNNLKFRVTDVDMNISVNNKPVGRVTQMDRVVIPARSSELYQLKFEVQLTGLMGGMLTLMQIAKQDEIEIHVEGQIKGKSFLFGRVINIDERSKVKNPKSFL